jgi:hypothetical protein
MKLALNKQSPKIPKMIVVGFLLLAISPPVAFSTSVEVQKALKSGQTVRLTVLLVGKTQPGAKVKIYRYELGPGQEAKPRFSLIADNQGRVFPPKLTPGHYHVVASAPKNLTAELYLDISAQDSENASEFSMELAIGGITRGELFTQAEQMPIKERVRSFHGIVCDPTGNPISEVSIEVVRKGSRGKDRVARLTSGNRGQFSARLSDGRYIARFSAPGFQIRFVPIEINEQGSGDLIVTLEIGRSA